jgi:hypothetical protein
MAKQETKHPKGRITLLHFFLLLLLFSIFFLVVYSAMQEDNYDRRVIVPEALDAPYQPYRPSMNGAREGQVMPIDSMMRDLYVVQREINQGSHQLYVFFDTFTHRPAPLDLNNFDLKNPQDAQWYNFAIYLGILLIIVGPTLLTYIKRNYFIDRYKKAKNAIQDKEEYQKTTPKMKKVLDFIKRNKMMVVIIVFMLAILLSMINLSIPLDKDYEYRADPFFVFVCFLSIVVVIISASYAKKFSKNIKMGGDTSLQSKNALGNTLIFGALGAWALGFLCYFIGMYSLGTQKSVLASIVRPALESGKMFVLSDTVKEISFTLRSNGAFMGFYTLCKLACLFISSFALVSLAWTRINSYWSIWDRSRGPGELFVFFGINDNSKILAKDIAAELKQDPENDYTLVLVENRNSPVDGMGGGMSISSLVGMFNFRKDAYAEANDISPEALLVISDSSLGSNECSDEINKLLKRIYNNEKLEKKERYAPFDSIGLKNLSKMIKHATKCHFFFLNDDARANIDATDNLRKMLHIAGYLKEDATIYCLARHNAFSTVLESHLPSYQYIEQKDEHDSKDSSKEATTQDVKIIEIVDKVKVKILDLSLMATQLLFKDPENHPVNFVECDTRTATVKSPFEALLIGFGRGGRDIVRYLYEFGAFLDHKCVGEAYAGDNDGHPVKIARSPFRCTILDKNINMIRPRYMAKIPAVEAARNNGDANDPLLQFVEAALNSDKFVKLIQEKLSNPHMNYIVISIGDDKTNMGALTFIVDQAMRIRKGNLGKLRIFVRNYEPTFESTMKEQASHFNKLLGGEKPVVTIFGDRLSLMTYEMVVEDEIEVSAKIFFNALNELKNDPEADWDQRHKESHAIGSDGTGKGSISWQNQSRVLRQETQDIHNGMHIDTKLRLIGIVRNSSTDDEQQMEKVAQLRDAVSITDGGNKYDFTSSRIDDIDLRTVYENLARNEHLRWTASLEMLGYQGAEPGTLQQCDEAAKLHPCLIGWNELDKASLSHYQTLSYLLIKTSFKVAYDELELWKAQHLQDKILAEQAKKDALEQETKNVDDTTKKQKIRYRLRRRILSLQNLQKKRKATKRANVSK